MAALRRFPPTLARRLCCALIMLATLSQLGADAPPGPAPTPAPAELAQPQFPKEHAEKLFAALESMMITGEYRDIDKIVWEGVAEETRERWRKAMKHEFQQVTYKDKYSTSIYDWRCLQEADLARIKSLPANLPPTATVWKVWVDIDYRYHPKSSVAATPANSAATAATPGESAGGSTLTPVEIDAKREEQATVCFYLIDSGGDLRIIGSDRDFFL
ncbi:MAG TPA: hypothetical protein VL860_09080, partial [Planctomycetota bacterium]|nr:hypothetical protein [Planctomycetota bacterium]